MNTALNPAMGIATIDFGTYLRSDAKHIYTLNLSEKSLLECINERVKQKERLHPNYGKSMSCLKHNLRELEQEYGCTIMPEHITQIFWEGFLDRLINVKKMSFATVQTVSSQLRTTLEWAARYKAELSPDYAEFDVPNAPKFLISLTPDDVSRIYHFDINTIPRKAQYLRTLERVRDQFVLQCNLGQRYSDISRLQPMHFKGNTFSIIQQKTGNKATVNMDEFSIDRKTVYEILKKYHYRSPYPRDISNFNHYLHELMQYVGFTEVLTYEEKRSGKIIQHSKAKWQLITSHTARRTFVTINITRGKNIMKLKKCTGHVTTESFEKYYREDED